MQRKFYQMDNSELGFLFFCCVLFSSFKFAGYCSLTAVVAALDAV